MELSVIIPAYNEEDSIKTTLKRVREYNKKSKIVVIDDGSKDRTAERAKRMGADVIHHEKNQGYGAALKTGLKSVDTKYAAFIDADMTYDPQYIPELLRYAKKENLDCVWGNRFGGNLNKMPRIRKIGNKIISLVFYIVTRKRVSDCSSGERIIKTEALKKLDLDTMPNDLDFITALTKRVVSRGLRYQEIPIDYSDRRGSSKLNLLKHGYKMIKNVICER